jgi:hypothetical protein
MFNPAFDSKLRGCDGVALTVEDVVDSSSTDDSRLRGALPHPDIGQIGTPAHLRGHHCWVRVRHER